MKQLNRRAFTIVELMIATTVFSVILIVLSSALLQIGRIYYKGIISSRTQETARTIVDDISRALQFNGGAVGSNTPSDYYCVGGRRYSFVLNQKVQDSPAVHGLIVDTPTGDCVASGSQNVGAPSGSYEEMLSPNMRVNALEVASLGAASLYSVKVRVVYAVGDDLLTPGKDACLDERASSQYCAVSELNTIIQKRIQ